MNILDGLREYAMLVRSNLEKVEAKDVSQLDLLYSGFEFTDEIIELIDNGLLTETTDENVIDLARERQKRKAMSEHREP